MKYYKISLMPTERTLHIFMGDLDLKQIKKLCGKELKMEAEWNGAYLTTDIENNGEPIIWIKKETDTATVIHEIVHCVEDLMRITGIRDEEFRAWYTDWLFREINQLKY